MKRENDHTHLMDETGSTGWLPNPGVRSWFGTMPGPEPPIGKMAARRVERDQRVRSAVRERLQKGK